MTRDVLIVSDTHGRLSRFNDLISYRSNFLREGEVLNVIFLGDGLSDLFALSQYDNIIVHAVRGNCDAVERFSPCGEEMPTSRLIHIGSHKIFITHGHTFGVKSGYDELCRQASRLQADIVMFGHTHIPTLEYIEKGSIRGVEKDLVIFNPGSLGELFEGSFGNLSLVDDRFLLSHGKYRNIIGQK